MTIANIKPTMNPSKIELNVTAAASYTYTLWISSFLTPIDLKTPNSHIFSFTFWEVEISNRKNAMTNEIIATIIKRIWKAYIVLPVVSSN